MSKIKRDIYIIGIIIAIVLGVICSLLFTKNSEELLFNKNALDSYYLGSNTDFIVPGPSKEQSTAIEQDDNNGIKEIVPYYSFTTGISVNSKNGSGVGYAFQSKDVLIHTPYNGQRILKGKIPQSGEAIVDYTFMKKNKCKIGDVVSFVYKDQQFKYTVVAESESNLDYINHSGTVAVVLRAEEKQLFEDNKLIFSGAFVKADDYAKCLDYLSNEYKPLSRLKSRDSFDTEEAYQLHVDKFNAYDWMKETTDFQVNYKSLSVKYENATQTIVLYQIIESVIIIVALFCFTALMLCFKTHKNNMDVFMRKNKNMKQLLKVFSLNNVVVVLVFCVVYIAFSFGLIAIERSLFQSPYVLLLLIPIIISVGTCGVNIVFCSGILRKRYKK